MGTMIVGRFESGSVVMEIDYVDATKVATLMRVRHNGSRAAARFTLIHPDRSAVVDHSVNKGRADTASIPGVRAPTLVDTGSGVDFPPGFFIQCSYPA